MKKAIVAIVAAVALLIPSTAQALVTPTLSVGTRTETSIRLNWTDAGNETSYSLRRDGVTIVTLAKNVLTYNNTGLTASTTYTYVVRAHNSKTGRILESNPVTASTTGAPPPPPPPSDCTGVQVPAGADLRAAMTAQTTAATFCLAAGTYEIGTTPITPQSGDVLIGVPVTMGPNGEVSAPTKIHGTSSTGVFRSPSLRAPFRVENADISGSTTTCFYHSNGFALTLRKVRVHDCLETAAGMRGVSLLEDVEIDHNGSAQYLEWSGGGIKVAFDANPTIRRAYVHDNIGNGIWYDCDVRAGVIEDSTIVRNSLSGVFVEISSGDGGGFFIRRNVIQNNNTAVAFAHAGVLVANSQNVSITDNTFGGNGAGRGIELLQDSRSGNGHAGCSGGFPNANITGSGNIMNGDTSEV